MHALRFLHGLKSDGFSVEKYLHYTVYPDPVAFFRCLHFDPDEMVGCHRYGVTWTPPPHPQRVVEAREDGAFLKYVLSRARDRQDQGQEDYLSPWECHPSRLGVVVPPKVYFRVSILVRQLGQWSRQCII